MSKRKHHIRKNWRKKIICLHFFFSFTLLFSLCYVLFSSTFSLCILSKLIVHIDFGSNIFKIENFEIFIDVRQKLDWIARNIDMENSIDCCSEYCRSWYNRKCRETLVWGFISFYWEVAIAIYLQKWKKNTKEKRL